MKEITKDNFEGVIVLIQSWPNLNYPDLVVPKWWLDYGIRRGYIQEGDWYSQKVEGGVRYYICRKVAEIDTLKDKPHF